MRLTKILSLLLAALLCVTGLLAFSACSEEEISDALDLVIDILEEETDAPTVPADTPAADSTSPPPAQTEAAVPAEAGTYTEKDDVALYLWTYKHLPSNFLTKDEARDKGWEGGNLHVLLPGCRIGGDRFGNYEGLLPAGEWRECDIVSDQSDGRGACRLVFAADGSRIYFTDDHYESFTLLYGEE